MYRKASKLTMLTISILLTVITSQVQAQTTSNAADAASGEQCNSWEACAPPAPLSEGRGDEDLCGVSDKCGPAPIRQPPIQDETTFYETIYQTLVRGLRF
jgi:hypothetical protein